MTRFFAAADNSFVNLDHVVHVEIVGPATMRGDEFNGTYQVRARTTIAWGTAGYGHGIGHLVVLGDKFPNELSAREWVVSNLNTEVFA